MMVGKGQQVGVEECEVLDKLVGLVEEMAQPSWLSSTSSVNPSFEGKVLQIWLGYLCT